MIITKNAFKIILKNQKKKMYRTLYGQNVDDRDRSKDLGFANMFIRVIHFISNQL